ncbi:hypothetical protein F4780DRAFT_779539 [Xylariomycetidae sp. FL0641]|nr:hypothetical protein F4780DRAFT_779539 [Xylariomycetidae sp. FL0641]
MAANKLCLKQAYPCFIRRLLLYYMLLAISPLNYGFDNQIVAVALQIVVTLVLPYLLNAPYAALHSKFGFIFGALTALSLLFAFFFVLDCRGRQLEDVDRLFEANVPPRMPNKVDMDSLPDPAVEAKKDDLDLKAETAHLEVREAV